MESEKESQGADLTHQIQHTAKGQFRRVLPSELLQQICTPSMRFNDFILVGLHIAVMWIEVQLGTFCMSDSFLNSLTANELL
jgi:hypothetical protein